MLFKPAALAAFAGVASAAAAAAPAAANSIGQHQNGGTVYGGRPSYWPIPDNDDDGKDDGNCPPQTPTISTHAPPPATSAPAATTTSAVSSSTSQPFWATKYTATGTAEVAAAAATAKTLSKTSNVQGLAFNKIMIIIFENTDWDVAIADPNFAYYAENGITLSNYHASTHPSEPNYIALGAGDYFGCDNDDMSFLPSNVSTVVDLLEEKGISWATYQEDAPFTGYEGFSWNNPFTGKGDYVRKHNPLVIANSVTESEDRLALIKNLSMYEPEKSMFHKDLRDNMLPQWSFVTPNLTSDAHDSNITVAGVWLRDFLDNNVLRNEKYMEDAVIFICFDEDATYTKNNSILGILYGPAVPQKYVGTTDDNFYTQYSSLSTVEANWGLNTLGRFDVGANVWKFVADKSHDEIREWDLSLGPFPSFNESYAGPLNSGGGNKRYPAPNLDLVTKTGRKVSPKIQQMWKGSDAPTYYENTVNIPTGQFPPKGYEADNLS